jgi:hypothetical protein
MHCFTLIATLLAEERLEYLTRGFRQRPDTIDPNGVVLSLGVGAVFVLGLWLLSRWMDSRQERRPLNSRLGLFVSLCRAHGLQWREWWLLWRVARRHRLREPARVFLEPQRLEPGSLGRGFEAYRAQLEALSRRLFAGLSQGSAKRKGC